MVRMSKFCHEFSQFRGGKLDRVAQSKKKRQEKESNINHVVYYLYNKVYKLVFVLLFSKIIGNIVIVFECT